MAGKYSHLKQVLDAKPQDASWQAQIDKVKPSYQAKSMAEKGNAFHELRLEKDGLEDQLKQINTRLEAITQLLLSDLEGEGLDKVRLDNGVSLAIKDEPYCSLQDRAAFLAWVKKSGQEDLLTVHYQTMSGLVKSLLQEGKSAPPGIKAYIKSSITRYLPR